MKRPVFAVLMALHCLASAAQAAVDAFYPELDSAEVERVRRAIDAYKADERGPYFRLRWFCRDETVHAPAGTPCRERGGGVQHAELKPEAEQLGDLGIHFGTILQTLDFAEFVDEAHDHYLLRELVVQRFLFDVDDGWVLRKARYYRGARQIEDEEKTGREFLERLLSRSEWVARNYLLASELSETVPHGGGVEPRTERIRNLATEIANLDPEFQSVRVKIHSFPSREDLVAVERFAARKKTTTPAADKLAALAEALRRQYESSAWAEELSRYLPRVDSDLRRALERIASAPATRPSVAAIGATLVELRRRVTSTEPAPRLTLLELRTLLLQRAFAILSAASGTTQPALSRRERVAALRDLVDLATGAGLLSMREREAFRSELDALLATRSLTALAYGDSLRYLARALDWGVGTVRASFGTVLERYAYVEPKAAGFSDALVRSSPLLFLAQELEKLNDDLALVLGQSHEIFGARVGAGVRGLNPGVALRPLELIEPGAHAARLETSKIYVIPETLAELTPPAGVLTLDAGNPLSHVQLLARNAGIPNASISSTFLPSLREHRGREVFFAVSPRGTVILKPAASLTSGERALVEQSRDAKAERIELDTSRLDIRRASPIPLEDLKSSDIGAVVGPKAGKVAELARSFPGNVSAGTALPFGMFAEHVNRPFGGDDHTAQERIVRAYQEAERLRSSGSSESAIDEYMFAELARFRRAILELAWIPTTRDRVTRALSDAFGTDLSRGVFVRSDTNVEDLPQFSGAGLNLTVPHQRGVEAILSSVKRVWTSPFSERAYLWRKQILVHQGEVYPSVLLLESVASEKSGVLITSGLQYGGASELTLAVAEGVGGAVDGEEAETILVRQDGSHKLLSQAKAARKKQLAFEGDGGVRTVPTARPDRLIQDSEIRQLLEVVAQWQRQAGATRVWDFEFGFVEGKLWLFQVRPFVRFRNTELLEKLGVLDEASMRNASRAISLEEIP